LTPDNLPRRTDHRHHPHPLSLIRHRDQLLPMSAPFDVASHAEERPADLPERLVAISANRNLTSALRPGTRSRLRALAVLVEPDRWHGAGSEQECQRQLTLSAHSQCRSDWGLMPDRGGTQKVTVWAQKQRGRESAAL